MHSKPTPSLLPAPSPHTLHTCTAEVLIARYSALTSALQQPLLLGADTPQACCAKPSAKRTALVSLPES